MQTSPLVGVRRQAIIFSGWNAIRFIFRDQDIVTISQTLNLVLFLFFFSLRFELEFLGWDSSSKKTSIAMISELFLTVGKFGWG